MAGEKRVPYLGVKEQSHRSYEVEEEKKEKE
jgi:hypothetical protein